MGGPVWAYGADVAYVMSADRVVVLDLTLPEDEPRILSESGSTIWRAIDGVRDEDAVAKYVADEYGLATADIESDVRAFLSELAHLSLIRPATGTS